MNKGLNLQKEQEEIRGDEWRFGANSKPSLFAIGISARENYLPIGELQNIGSEKYDCVTRAYINKLEAEFTYAYQNNKLTLDNKKWLEDNGYVQDGKVVFSDAFIGILSGTTRAGNSLKAPAHAIHKHGLIPKNILPQLEDFDIHYDIKRITQSMYKLGQDFIKRFPIYYEQVDAVNMEKALEMDMTAIAIFAYGGFLNGEYLRAENPFNHCVLAYKLPRTYVYDNYTDINDGDFIKKLSNDYAIYPYGYRVYIEEQSELTEEQRKGFMAILKWIAEQLGIIQKQVDALPKPVVKDTYEEVKEVLKGRLDEFCLAIRDYEGKPGDLNYRNNNPGNIRGTDGKFLKFNSYEQGFAYLKEYVIRACTGKHKAYPKDPTILQFFKVYAPSSDNNNPEKYAKWIATRMKSTVDTKVSSFL